MARSRTKETNGNNGNGANLGFEQTLWTTADKMCGHMDAAEYKHVALGLIFLKYISDAFQELYDDLAAKQETDYTDPEDRDEYLGMNELVSVPIESIQKLFFDTVRPLVDNQHSNENFVLTEIRDRLLPKPLSGELPVRDAEKVLEAAT